MTIEIISKPRSYASLRENWNSLILDDPKNMLGLDATSSYEWFEAILATFPKASESFILVARESQEIVGILPVIIDRSFSFGPRLLLPTELYGGRNGPLLKQPDPELLANMLDSLGKACPDWTTFHISLVAGSECERAFLEGCRQQGYGISHGMPMESHFISPPPSNESLWAGMAKDLKQRIRSGERKLVAQGAVSFRRYTHEEEAVILD